MIFNSLTYLLFLAVVVLLIRLLQAQALYAATCAWTSAGVMRAISRGLL